MTPRAPAQPNILILFTDQLRADILSAYGGTICRTPTVDRLAAESTVFTRAYTPTAVCSPARGSLITGQYPHNHGVIGNHEHQMSPGMLQDSPDLLSRRLEGLGYDRYYLGKWHLGDETNLPHDVGLPGNQFAGHGDGGYDYPEFREYLARKGLRHEVTPDPDRVGAGRYGVIDGPEEAEVSAFLTDEALGFLDRWNESDADSPFFCWVNYWGPHEPYYPTRDYLEMYDGVEIPPWPNMHHGSDLRPAVHDLKTPALGQELGWEYWESAVRHYFAFMTLIDHQMGRLLDKLDEIGQRDNTIIVFAADHGESLGAHGCVDKGFFMYEEIYRIPLMISVPGVAPGRDDRLVSTVDLCPTLLDAAGDVDPEGGRDGRSLLALLDPHGRQPKEWRDTVVSEFHGLITAYTQRMITDERYKYIWNVGNVDELYDLQDDPHELANLITDPGTQATVERMQRRLLDWMHETGDDAAKQFAGHMQRTRGARR